MVKNKSIKNKCDNLFFMLLFPNFDNNFLESQNIYLYVIINYISVQQ